MRIFHNLSIILLLVLFSCQNQKGEIHYIDIYTTTVRSVTCENLMQSTHKKKLLLSNIENMELSKIFSNLKPAESGWNIDARIYGIVYDRAKRLDFCMSTTIIEINNKKYFVNDQLRDYIIKLTTKK